MKASRGIKELTKGVGADAVLECVGTQEAMMQAIGVTRPGGSVGYVGVPHGVSLDGEGLFFRHVRLHGGPAPVADAYRAMDERRAIKTLLRV